MAPSVQPNPASQPASQFAFPAKPTCPGRESVSWERQPIQGTGKSCSGLQTRRLDRSATVSARVYLLANQQVRGESGWSIGALPTPGSKTTDGGCQISCIPCHTSSNIGGVFWRPNRKGGGTCVCVCVCVLHQLLLRRYAMYVGKRVVVVGWICLPSTEVCTDLVALVTGVISLACASWQTDMCRRHDQWLCATAAGACS